MEPLPHPRRTHRYGAPKNWDAGLSGPCDTLEVAQVDGAGGRGVAMESLWRPGPTELAVLNEGGAVILTIQGSAHPVVSLGVTGPEQLEPGQ